MLLIPIIHVLASFHTRPRARALVALTLPVFAAFACMGGGATQSSVLAPQGTQTAVSDVAGAAATPSMLPITPVAREYTIAAPAFEALPGARAIYGVHEGAAYQIEVPDGWNGSVLYFAHGFRGSQPELTVTAPPIRGELIAGGFAWAASSYSQNGYEPGVGARDMYTLREVFEREAGVPRRSYVYGQSMGGHVVSVLLEQHPDAYDGALSECGVVSGNEILDYFLSWGILAGYFSGVELQGTSADPQRFARAVRDMAQRLGSFDAPAPEGRAFMNAIMHLTGGQRPFFMEGLGGNYTMNFAILVGAVAAPGAANAASQNVDTVYAIDEGFGVTSEELNRDVERVAANPAYRDPERYPEFAPLTGEIATPYLTLHNTGDLFVPISLEQSYRRTVEEAGNGELLVQRAIRRGGHCNFTGAERVRAWDDLVAWVERGEKPAGDDMLGDLREAGRAFTSPLEPGDPGRVRP